MQQLRRIKSTTGIGPVDSRAQRDLQALLTACQQSKVASIQSVHAPGASRATGFICTLTPEAGIYKGHAFRFVAVLPKGNSRYPFAPVRLETTDKFLHPNVNWRNGDVSLRMITKHEWKPQYTLSDVVRSLLDLFYEPDFEHMDPFVQNFLSTVMPHHQGSSDLDIRRKFESLVGTVLQGGYCLGEFWPKTNKRKSVALSQNAPERRQTHHLPQPKYQHRNDEVHTPILTKQPFQFPIHDSKLNNIPMFHTKVQFNGCSIAAPSPSVFGGVTTSHNPHKMHKLSVLHQPVNNTSAEFEWTAYGAQVAEKMPPLSVLRDSKTTFKQLRQLRLLRQEQQQNNNMCPNSSFQVYGESELVHCMQSQTVPTKRVRLCT
jgi:ubiquitin-protein ligase